MRKIHSMGIVQNHILVQALYGRFDDFEKKKKDKQKNGKKWQKMAKNEKMEVAYQRLTFSKTY